MVKFSLDKCSEPQPETAHGSASGSASRRETLADKYTTSIRITCVLSFARSFYTYAHSNYVLRVTCVEGANANQRTHVRR